ncbi:hypothetical protein EGT74_23455 [Chitinophaga lutea]|uniref:Uncharacterized protein n=1 Tax=Chitinophaga lutea TaxID=2488634 RepID=A0A3N4PFR3_9BACT|nr:hypothetical protein EGT74_23455 [Chitinophaga lutea]
MGTFDVALLYADSRQKIQKGMIMGGVAGFSGDYYKKCVSLKLLNFKLTIWTNNNSILKHLRSRQPAG